MNQSIEVEKIPDKNIIDVTVYEIDKNSQLHTYTATWCGPCKKIKPIVIDIMSKRGYKIISQTTIEKAVFKRDINEFVPFFILFQMVDIF